MGKTYATTWQEFVTPLPYLTVTQQTWSKLRVAQKPPPLLMYVTDVFSRILEVDTTEVEWIPGIMEGVKDVTFLRCNNSFLKDMRLWGNKGVKIL